MLNHKLLNDRAAGALLGLAVGDALGVPLEFSQRDAHPLTTEMLGGGPFGLNPGEWTDDTSMALALADSLVRCRGFDADNLMYRFISWVAWGDYSHNGRCFDCGLITRRALYRFERVGDPFAGSDDPDSAGNGSLMRVAPVALFGLHDEALASYIAREQSRTTHAAIQAVEACDFFIRLLREAILGANKDHVLRPRDWAGDEALSRIASGGWRDKSRDRIRSGGYVLDTLEAALWAVGRTNSFENALILAVNLGHDADTVGAVTGALAGSIYGASMIPDRWLKPLAWRDRIERGALNLLRAKPLSPDLSTCEQRLSDAKT